MLVFRYLFREVFFALVSLTVILLLIFMSNQLVRYLTRAASGQIPGMFILKLMLLELPNLISLLIPLGFYVALLLAYGRLYAESEMTVLQACGYSSGRLLRHSLIMSLFVAILVLFLMLWVSPEIAVERTKLLRSSGVQTLIQTIIPGRFRAVSGGRDVFYVESMNRRHTEAKQVFFARNNGTKKSNQWDIIWAEQAQMLSDKKEDMHYVVLKDGEVYQGTPGKADFRISRFAEYKARLPHPTVQLGNDLRTAKSSVLWRGYFSDPQKAAELQWRISVPLMVIVLTICAVPLSRVHPRSGKFAKLLPALLLYIVYANFMFISRDWVAQGVVPVWIGMWWLHILVALVGLFLFWQGRKKAI